MEDKERQAKAEEQIEEEGLLGVEGAIPPEDEASFLNLRTILIAVAGLVGMVIVVQLIAGALFAFFVSTGPNGQPPAREGGPPPGPPLQVNPGQDLQQLRATQQAQLEGYGWVDRDGGRVRIPIQRAMELLAERGLPINPDSGFEPGAGGIPPVPSQPPGSEAPPGEQSPGDAQAGAQLYQELGCAGCHTEASTALAPTLVGLYGEPVPLEGGETVTADEEYLRQSIIDPHAQIVAGYQPIMPSYAGRITDGQLQALVAYIISLGEAQ